MTKTVINYMRLITGDEIVSEVIVGPEVVTLRNPLIIEYMEMKGGANYPFMTRYSPYSVDHSVRVDKKHIMFIGEPSVEMVAYYKTSLDYAEKTCDKLITDRLIEADRYIVDADTPASPITTTPPDPSQVIYSFPDHNTIQ